MNAAKQTNSSLNQLPDFCQAATLYLIVIASVILALLLSFATANWQQQFWIHLSLYSLFILWTSLTSLEIGRAHV